MEEEPRDLRLGVMDDDPAVASVAASMVEVLGGEGRAVSQLPELMEMIEHWRPSHLVIDLVMPDVDGMQVLKALADAGCRARIIICSGMSDGVLDAAMRSASAHGLDVVGVLPKPFRLRELKALLERPLTPFSAAAPQLSAIAPTETPRPQGLELRWVAKVDCGSRELVGFSVVPAGTTAGVDAAQANKAVRSSIDRLDFARLASEAVAGFAARAGGGWFGLELPMTLDCLEDPTLLETLAALSRDHDIDPRRITLQLPDTSALVEALSSLEWLTRARMKGFQLSLSHFGAGSAALIDLVRLPLSELVLDARITAGLPDKPESRLLAKCVCDLASNLGFRVTADGVIAPEALPVLDALGCHYAQGPAIAAATDLDEAWKSMHPS